MKRASPVRPMRIFVPTEDAKTPVRTDIKRSVYSCVASTRKLAYSVCAARLKRRAPAPGWSREAVGERSHMKIHEYQAKAILSRHGVPVPRGEVAFTPG